MGQSTPLTSGLSDACQRSYPNNPSAASAITVPGGKIAAALASATPGKSWADDAADDDHDVVPPGLGFRASSSSGTRVRWPAASDDTPTMWTSASTACEAASAGV